MPSLLFLNRNLVSHYFYSFLFLLIIFILITFKTVELFHTSLMHALFWPCFSTVSRFGTATLFLKTSIFLPLKKHTCSLIHWTESSKAIKEESDLLAWSSGTGISTMLSSVAIPCLDLTWLGECSLLLWSVLLVLWDIAVDWLLQCTQMLHSVNVKEDL